MRRWAFHILAGLSLVLFLGTAVMFGRSFWVSEGWMRQHWDGAEKTRTAIDSISGQIIVGRDRIPQPTPPRALQGPMDQWLYLRHEMYPGDGSGWYKPRYSVHKLKTTGGNVMGTIVAIPYWLVLLPLAIVPSLWLVGFLRRRHRRQRGLCLTCGYDLRASPERCPECGTATPSRGAQDNVADRPARSG